jgi:hypothetical protein
LEKNGQMQRPSCNGREEGSALFAKEGDLVDELFVSQRQLLVVSFIVPKCI